MGAKNIIENLKKHPFVLWVLLIAALVGGIASFFSSVDSIVALSKKYFDFQKKVEIRSPENPLTIKESDGMGFELTYGHKGENEYALLLHIAAKFKDEIYNRERLFLSVSEIHVSQKERTNSTMHVERKYVNFSNESHSLEGFAFLVFDGLPNPGKVIEISLGAVKWEVPIGKHKWLSRKYRYGDSEEGWKYTQASIDLPLNKPSWPVLESARLLRTDDSQVSLVEVLVENHSKEPLPLENLVIIASHPKDSGVSCEGPDRKQYIYLDWSLIESEKTVNSAWTKLNDTRVKVPVRYNGRGFCSPYSFLAVVPLQSSIEPGKVGRVVLSLNELPKQERDTRRSMRMFGQRIPLPSKLDSTPGPISNWVNFEVGLNKGERSKPVYPSFLTIMRDNEAEILLKEYDRMGLTKKSSGPP